MSCTENKSHYANFHCELLLNARNNHLKLLQSRVECQEGWRLSQLQLVSGTDGVVVAHRWECIFEHIIILGIHIDVEIKRARGLGLDLVSILL